jgi:malate dehydrogenase (oxaloacetate-decarboxylating)
MDFGRESIRQHLRHQGKIGICSKFPKISSLKDLSVAYTPGIAAVATLLAKYPEKSSQYVSKGNNVAVISDGSAVLGLGNIGPCGAFPVMEGKALLFKEFGNVDAIPIVLDTQNVEEIISIIKAIAPSFGGIVLEDISSPRCFEIEERLISNLDIPVFHDDQHGTSIVVLAALINSLKIVMKDFKTIKIVISGAGAAGISITKLLIGYGIKNIVLVDSKGIINLGRKDLNSIKQSISRQTNPNNQVGGLKEALMGADVFIGVSTGGVLKPAYIQAMANKPIIFALANPVPEIMPNLAKQGGAFIIGTGRSDFPNQINNVLVFPGLFRGVLDNNIRFITDVIKIRVAKVLANTVKKKELRCEKILPSVLDANVVTNIANSLSDLTNSVD